MVRRRPGDLRGLRIIVPLTFSMSRFGWDSSRRGFDKPSITPADWQLSPCALTHSTDKFAAAVPTTTDNDARKSACRLCALCNSRGKRCVWAIAAVLFDGDECGSEVRANRKSRQMAVESSACSRQRSRKPLSARCRRARISLTLRVDMFSLYRRD